VACDDKAWPTATSRSATRLYRRWIQHWIKEGVDRV
jgi:hypothetical protein